MLDVPIELRSDVVEELPKSLYAILYAICTLDLPIMRIVGDLGVAESISCMECVNGDETSFFGAEIRYGGASLRYAAPCVIQATGSTDQKCAGRMERMPRKGGLQLAGLRTSSGLGRSAPAPKLYPTGIDAQAIDFSLS